MLRWKTPTEVYVVNTDRTPLTVRSIGSLAVTVVVTDRTLGPNPLVGPADPASGRLSVIKFHTSTA